MSQFAQVIRDTSNLVDAIVDLLASDSAKEIPNIARGLKALPQLTAATNALAKVVADVLGALTLLQKPLLQADALVALVGMLPDFISGLGQVVSVSGAVLADMGLGLDGARAACNLAGDKIGQVSQVLEMGVDVGEAALSLVSPTEINRLCRDLQQLGITIRDFTKAANDEAKMIEEKQSQK